MNVLETKCLFARNHSPAVHSLLSRLIVPMALGLAYCSSAATDDSKSPEPLNWTADQDHKNMMEQLGIRHLRPGPSGNPTATNSANYDQAKANPFPDLPDLLTLKNGQKVTTAEVWWKRASAGDR